MAQFKFVGHSNGAFPEYKADSAVTVKGTCEFGKPGTFEIEVMPNEVFDLSNDWAMAISSLESTERNGQPVYERVS
jgi:hypothetical protein